MRVGTGRCTGGRTVRGSRVHCRFPLPSCGTAANVDQGVAQNEEIHPQEGAHRTERSSYCKTPARDNKVCWRKFVFGQPYFNRNPMHVADDRVMLKAFSQCPESHFIRASHLQKTFDSYLSFRNNDSSVISASMRKSWTCRVSAEVFVLQLFNIVVKRTGSHSVPAISVSNHQAPTLTPREVLSTRKSHPTTDSPIDKKFAEFAI